MDQSLNFSVHTFGCKVNTYDTGLIQKDLLGTFGETAEGEVSPRVHVLNTCAVTAEATKQAVKLIRKLKAGDPFCTIVVTGCAAQVDTDAFSNLPSVDLIVANSHKKELPSLIRSHFKGTLPGKVFKSNIFRKEDLGSGGGIEKYHTRSFLKIQDGCNSFCSYCIIPFARGKSRSLPAEELVEKINELGSQGVAEVVLTGVHIGDYSDLSGANRNLILEDLIEIILKKTTMPRLRLSSLEPVELTPRLVELYQDERMCRHFHMSIQSAQTDVLKDMKRNYDQESVKKALLMIAQRIPGSFVGMDVIAGFPTETEARFNEGFEVLRDLPWNKLHVFPYSERTGTKAMVLPQTVSWAERVRRAALLRKLSDGRWEKTAQDQIGELKRVLVLKKPSRGAQGLSRDYWNLEINETPEVLQTLVGREILMRVESLAPRKPSPAAGSLERALRGVRLEGASS